VNTALSVDPSRPSGGPPIPPPRDASRREILPASRAERDTASTVTIASISDQDWYISRTHGVYHIPACPKKEPPGSPQKEAEGKTGSPGPRPGGPEGAALPYSLLLITARGDAIDLGDNRRFPFTISAREIAEDLLQDLRDHGVFVCAGPRPTESELSAARDRRDAFYHQLVADGDSMWARGHSFREISDLHRRAAIALGIEREWAYVPVRMADCPACGEKVKPGVAVCRHCRAILDPERAAKHGLTSSGPSSAAPAPAETTAATTPAPSASVNSVRKSAPEKGRDAQS
jgi:hypothetical protein